MRDSAWRITWNPSGATPRVLLDYGDLMDEELARDVAQLVDIARFDQAVTARPYGRGNRKRRLEFSRTVEFASALDAWEAMLQAETQNPWAEKRLLEIAPLSGASQFVMAALISTGREIVTQPFPGYHERLALRIGNGAPSGPAITIIDGWYNPPVVGGGTTSGSITVTVGAGHGLVPGDVVHVSGVGGVANGYYTVTNVSENNVTINASSDRSPADEFPDVFGRDALDPPPSGYPSDSPQDTSAGAVNFNGTVSLRVSGMTEVGAVYEWRCGGAWNTITPDAFGRAEINYATRLLRIDHGEWYRESYSSYVLLINGESQPLLPWIPSGQVTESRTDLDVFELRKNGVKIDEHRVTPNFRCEKRWVEGAWVTPGPVIHEVATGKTLTITLRADGGIARLDTGVAERITSGTLIKAE